MPYVKVSTILVTCFVFILCNITLIVSANHNHNRHSRDHHLFQNQFYRHSHNRRQHLNLHQQYHQQMQRSTISKRPRGDLDTLLEKLSPEKLNESNYFDNENNNLDSSLIPLNIQNNIHNETVTTERWRVTTVSPLLSGGVKQDLDNNNDKNVGEVDEDDDEDSDDYDTDDNEDVAEESRHSSVHPVNTQSDSENGYRGSISDLKWKTMSNKKALDSLFDAYRSGVHIRQPMDITSSDQNEALKHSKRMSRETTCKVPRPKVIKVSDHYPGTDKYYLPACTILHQCTEDSGCCAGATQKCTAKRTQQVTLYFYVTSFVFLGQTKKSTTNIEKLKFYNHTECECQDHRDEEMPRDSTLRELQQRSYMGVPEMNCRCPSEYTVRHLANGSCSCDCFDKQRDCIKYKKGKEYFNHSDRLCIEVGKCLQPSCDFGVYNRRSGRCPRKHEKYRTWSRFT